MQKQKTRDMESILFGKQSSSKYSIKGLNGKSKDKGKQSTKKESFNQHN
jgi:hypothetical protein